MPICINRFLPFIMAGIALITLPLGTLALPSDKEQAIEIQANSAERDEKLGVTTYEGNVDIKQGSLHITAEKVTITTTRSSADDTEELESLTATGERAHFRQQLEAGGDFVEADAKTIHYVVSDRKVQLHGEAQLIQGGSIISGDRIVYDIAAQRVQARAEVNSSNAPVERVKVIIPPKKEQDPQQEEQAPTVETEALSVPPVSTPPTQDLAPPPPSESSQQKQ